MSLLLLLIPVALLGLIFLLDWLDPWQVKDGCPVCGSAAVERISEVHRRQQWLCTAPECSTVFVVSRVAA